MEATKALGVSPGPAGEHPLEVERRQADRVGGLVQRRVLPPVVGQPGQGAGHAVIVAGALFELHDDAGSRRRGGTGGRHVVSHEPRLGGVTGEIRPLLAALKNIARPA